MQIEQINMMSVYKDTKLIPKEQPEIEFSTEMEKYSKVFNEHMAELERHMTDLTETFKHA